MQLLAEILSRFKRVDARWIGAVTGTTRRSTRRCTENIGVSNMYAPRRRHMLLTRLLLPSVVVVAAACGDGDATSSSSSAGGGTGGASASSSSASTSATVGPSSSATTSGASTSGTGGVNVDDPYGCLTGEAPERPASIPEGFRPFTCWSQKPQCMLWIPEDPETQIDPLEWEPCAAGAPGGDGCQQLKRSWWRGQGTAIGNTFPGVPEVDHLGDSALLHVARMDIVGQGDEQSWIEWDVYDLDGAPKFGMRKHVPGEVTCRYQDYDVTEGVWAISPYGDDTEDLSSTPLDGLVAVDLAERSLSLPYRDDSPGRSGWAAGAGGFLRYTGPDLYFHDLAFERCSSTRRPPIRWGPRQASSS